MSARQLKSWRVGDGSVRNHATSMNRWSRWILLPCYVPTRRELTFHGGWAGATDAAVNGNAATVSMVRLNHITSLSSDLKILECEAGVSLDRILRVILPRGLFLPVTPGTRHVTVGGAIAADVHGKNHHQVGSFANFVQDFELLTVEGERLHCSREDHPDVFWATVGGMGLTGFITRARILLRSVESVYMSVRYEKAANLEDTFRVLEEGDRSYEYSVAWVDCAAREGNVGRSVTMFGRHATAEEIPARPGGPLALPRRLEISVPFAIPLAPHRRWALAALDAVYYAGHPTSTTRIVNFDRFFYPLDTVGNWNDLFGRHGFIECQVVVPHDRALTVIGSILERVRQSGRTPFLGVLKRFGLPSGGLLSFPMPGCTFGFDLLVDRDLPRLLREIEGMVVESGGRSYLAKDATQSADGFAQSYPRLDDFRAIQQRLDPHGRLSSSLSRRLQITSTR